MLGMVTVTGRHVFAFHTKHIQDHIKERKQSLGLCKIGLIRSEIMTRVQMQCSRRDPVCKSDGLPISRNLWEQWIWKHMYTYVDFCTWDVRGGSRCPLRKSC